MNTPTTPMPGVTIPAELFRAMALFRMTDKDKPGPHHHLAVFSDGNDETPFVVATDSYTLAIGQADTDRPADLLKRFRTAEAVRLIPEDQVVHAVKQIGNAARPKCTHAFFRWEDDKCIGATGGVELVTPAHGGHGEYPNIRHLEPGTVEPVAVHLNPVFLERIGKAVRLLGNNATVTMSGTTSGKEPGALWWSACASGCTLVMAQMTVRTVVPASQAWKHEEATEEAA